MLVAACDGVPSRRARPRGGAEHDDLAGLVHELLGKKDAMPAADVSE
jgi:hypothetical protein